MTPSSQLNHEEDACVSTIFLHVTQINCHIHDSIEQTSEVFSKIQTTSLDLTMNSRERSRERGVERKRENVFPGFVGGKRKRSTEILFKE